jgi:phosphoglycolate phosphatase
MSLRPQAVIFDLDGTLVDSAPGIEFASQSAWTKILPDQTCPAMRPLMGPPIYEMFRQALPTASSGMLAELECSFREAYDGGGWKKAVPYSGVPEALQALKEHGVRCLGVTNKPALPTQRILAHCGLERSFEVFLSPDSRQPIFASKSAALQALLEEWSIDPRSGCFIGDTVDDALAARACRVAFIAYSGGYGWTGLCAELPGVEMFDDFPALPALLLGRRMPVEWPAQPAPTTMKL